MNTRFLRSAHFWTPLLIVASLSYFFFLWEIGVFSTWIASPMRPALTQFEVLFTVLLIVLLSLNTGLYVWQKREGSCPTGTGRATGIAGILGATALLCPACTMIPFTLLGFSISFTFLSTYLPLLRLIAVVLLITGLIILWPRRSK